MSAVLTGAGAPGAPDARKVGLWVFMAVLSQSCQGT